MSPPLMNLFATVDPRPVHFMGIAGAGMSGLALLARQQGVTITGCDNDPSGAADLAALGVEIWRGPDPAPGGGGRGVRVPAAREGAFVEFASRARRAIVGADDAGAARVAARLAVPVWRMGLRAGADVRIADPALGERGSTARIELPGARALALRLRVPGLHNLRNAAAALAVVHELGADLERALAALAEFGGVGRRFERVGEARGITVVDDYAHHPTEVAATLAAARQAFPRRRVGAGFQPHLFSRTAPHGEALGRALAAADGGGGAPIYGAREPPLPGGGAALERGGGGRGGGATGRGRRRGRPQGRGAGTG